MNGPRPASRARQRLALYGGLALLVLGLWAAARFLDRGPPAIDDAEAWGDVDFASMPEVDLLRRYVRVDTSATTGSEVAGAEFLATELEAAGIPATVERLGDKSANVWGILEGEDPAALVLHNHIDVFPVKDPEGWDFPPFAAEIDRVWLYGRGVFDMKSVAIAQLLAMRALAASGVRPRRSLVFLATGSEEVGSELGTRWILEQHPELAERFAVVLTEGGIVEPVSAEKITYWGTEFAQKRFASGAFCSDSKEALERLRGDLYLWSRLELELTVTPEVEQYLEAYAATRTDPEYRRIASQPRRVPLSAPDYFALPDYLKALFRDELVPFRVEADPGGGYRLPFLFHLLPGSDPAAVAERLLPDWLTHGTTFVLEPPLGADAGSPLDHPAYRTLLAALGERFPEAPAGPLFLSWTATDSRFFRQAGIPSYGFTPFLIFTTDTFRVDGTNERIGLPGYLAGLDVYREVVERLVAAR